MEINKLCYPAMAVFNKHGIKIVCTLLLFHCFQDAASQTNLIPIDNLNQTVSIEGSITLDSITQYLHKNTGLRCSFNSVKVKGSKIIRFEKKKYTLLELLNYIRKSTSLHFNPYKDYVIFTDHPVASRNKLHQKLKRKQNKQYPMEPSNEKLITKPRNAKMIPNRINKFIQPNKNEEKTNPHPIKTSFFMNIISLPSDYIFNIPSPPAIFKNASAIKIGNKAENPSIPFSRQNKAKPIRLYAQIGYNLTDALFNNLTAEIGLSPIHIIANYGTNFKTSSLGLGIGSMILKKEQFQLKVNAVINSLGRNINFADTIAGSDNLKIKGSLYSIGPELMKQFKNKRVNLRLSLQYNLLKSKYYLNGQMTPPALLPNEIKNNSKKYSLAQPLFPINAFNGNEINYKTWIGLTLSIFYKIY